MELHSTNENGVNHSESKTPGVNIGDKYWPIGSGHNLTEFSIRLIPHVFTIKSTVDIMIQ